MRGGTSRRPRIQRLLAGALTHIGLIGLVVAVYLVIVLGVGRVPTGDERALLALSAAAAVASALLWVPVRPRVRRLAQQLAGRPLRDADDMLRRFQGGMTRAVPLDEILLQLAGRCESRSRS